MVDPKPAETDATSPDASPGALAAVGSAFVHAGRVLGDGLKNLWQRPATQVPALDALRAAAILLVIGDHYAFAAWQQYGGRPLPVQQLPVFTLGWTGVDLFFVLSGLLIGRQLWRELQSTGDIRVRRFLLRRGLRIWPLYFFFLLVALAINHAVRFRWSDWLFFSNYRSGALAGGWSLSTEEQFYVTVPILLVLFRKRIRLTHWFVALPLLIAGELIARARTIGHLEGKHLSPLAHDMALNMPIHLHCDALIAGLLIALLSVVRPAWFRRGERAGVSRAGLAVVAVCVVIAAFLHRMDRELFALLALALIFGSVTLWVLWDRSIITRPLESRLFYPISRLSYGMYLNHFFIIWHLNPWIESAARHRLGDGTSSFMLGLTAITALSVLAAAVTFVLVEHPFLAVRDQWLRHTAAAVERAPSAAAGELASA